MATDFLATVLCDLEYCNKNGEKIHMQKNEMLLVLEQTNSKWWKVIRSGEGKPFYAPMQNLEVLDVPHVQLRASPIVQDWLMAPLSTIDAGHGRREQCDVRTEERALSGGGPLFGSLDDLQRRPAAAPATSGPAPRADAAFRSARRSSGPEHAVGGQPLSGGGAGDRGPRAGQAGVVAAGGEGDRPQRAGSGEIGACGRRADAVRSGAAREWEWDGGDRPAVPKTSLTWERGTSLRHPAALPSGSRTWERGARLDPSARGPVLGGESGQAPVLPPRQRTAAGGETVARAPVPPPRQRLRPLDGVEAPLAAGAAGRGQLAPPQAAPRAADCTVSAARWAPAQPAAGDGGGCAADATLSCCPRHEHGAAADSDWDDVSSCDSLDEWSDSDGSGSLLLAEDECPDGPPPAGDDGLHVPLPAGWRRRRDSIGDTCYVRDTSPTRWYSCLDSAGRFYFFAEGSSEAVWSLPAAGPGQPPPSVPGQEPTTLPRPRQRPPSQPPPPPARPRPDRSQAVAAAGTGAARPPAAATAPAALGCGWPQLRAGDQPLLFIRQGTLNCKIKRTSRTQRKAWKDWCPHHVALTDCFLLLFKEVKGTANIQWGSQSHRPVLIMHLAGVRLRVAPAASRKNVLQLRPSYGSKLLLQDDSAMTTMAWAGAICSAISGLPDKVEPVVLPKAVANKLPRNRSNSASEVTEDARTRLARDDSWVGRRLKRFFGARPSADTLIGRGILKEEPVFGRNLTALCEAEGGLVPRFVLLCVRAIEASPDFLRTEGLYRVSPGLDKVQRLRCQVDHDNYAVLAAEEDPHVLAGALKLFCRELPVPILTGGQPLAAALQAAQEPPGPARTAALCQLVNSLESVHRETLRTVLHHLTRVAEQRAHGLMDGHNLALVFGPTLARADDVPAAEQANALIRRARLVEALLDDFGQVFEPGRPAG